MFSFEECSVEWGEGSDLVWKRGCVFICWNGDSANGPRCHTLRPTWDIWRFFGLSFLTENLQDDIQVVFILCRHVCGLVLRVLQCNCKDLIAWVNTFTSEPEHKRYSGDSSAKVL